MYNDAFRDIAEIETPAVKMIENEKMNGTEHSWHLYIIKLSLKHLAIDRNRFIDELKDRGIGTSVHFIPLHIHPYYREVFGYKPEDFLCHMRLTIR